MSSPNPFLTFNFHNNNSSEADSPVVATCRRLRAELSTWCSASHSLEPHSSSSVPQVPFLAFLADNNINTTIDSFESVLPALVLHNWNFRVTGYFSCNNNNEAKITPTSFQRGVLGNLQQQADPSAVLDCPVIFQAPSGSGKGTMCVLLAIKLLFESNILPAMPLRQRKDLPSRRTLAAPTVVYLCGRRELANARFSFCRTLLIGTGFRCGFLCGGISVRDQVMGLRGGVNILFSTPGRFYDFIQRGFVTVSNVRVLILEDAGELFEMGFKDQLYDLASELRKDVATRPRPVQVIAHAAVVPEELIEFLKTVPDFASAVPSSSNETGATSAAAAAAAAGSSSSSSSSSSTQMRPLVLRQEQFMRGSVEYTAFDGDEKKFDALVGLIEQQLNFESDEQKKEPLKRFVVSVYSLLCWVETEATALNIMERIRTCPEISNRCRSFFLSESEKNDCQKATSLSLAAQLALASAVPGKEFLIHIAVRDRSRSSNGLYSGLPHPGAEPLVRRGFRSFTHSLHFDLPWCANDVVEAFSECYKRNIAASENQIGMAGSPRGNRFGQRAPHNVFFVPEKDAPLMQILEKVL